MKMGTKKITTEIHGELFTHRLLWQCCTKQMEAARDREEDANHFHLTAMLMAYFTYEAYLNFLGDCVAPEIWRHEKTFFSKDPYRDTEGKLRKLAAICGFNVESGKRPHQTIVDLERLRDFVAHGKPDKYDETVRHHSGREPNVFGYDTLSRRVTQEKAKRAIADVEKFIECLHDRCRETVSDLRYGPKALKGSLGYAYTGTVET